MSSTLKNHWALVIASELCKFEGMLRFFGSPFPDFLGGFTFFFFFLVVGDFPLHTLSRYKVPIFRVWVI